MGEVCKKFIYGKKNGHSNRLELENAILHLESQFRQINLIYGLMVDKEVDRLYTKHVTCIMNTNKDEYDRANNLLE